MKERNEFISNKLKAYFEAYNKKLTIKGIRTYQQTYQRITMN